MLSGKMFTKSGNRSARGANDQHDPHAPENRARNVEVKGGADSDMSAAASTDDRPPLGDVPPGVIPGEESGEPPPPASAAPTAPAPAEAAGPSSPEAMQARIAELEDKLLRARAEFANFQRRVAAERQEAVRFANAELVRSLLGVLEDFDRSLKIEVQSEEGRNVLRGVQLVYENLTKALRDNGVEPIQAEGRPFDPAYHEALMRQPTDDHPPGTVIQEASRGYCLHGRVIRPARVVVSAPVETASPDEAEPLG